MPFIHSSETQIDDLHQDLQDQQPTNSDSPTKVLLNKSDSNDNVTIEYLGEDDLIFADGAANDFQMSITTGLSSKVINDENTIANEIERFESNVVASDDYISADTRQADSTDLSNVILAASDTSSERWVERIRMTLKKKTH